MQRYFEIQAITYKRKEIDRGIIIGRRPYKWTLGKKYSPCSARNIQNKRKISKLSPQKQNFAVYIPADELKIGDILEIICKEYQQEKIITQVAVTEIHQQHIVCDLISENVERKPTFTLPDIGKYALQTDEKVFGGEEGIDEWQAVLECVNDLDEYIQDPENEQSDVYTMTEEDILTIHAEQQPIDQGTPDPSVVDQPKNMKHFNGKHQGAFDFAITTLPLFTPKTVSKSETQPQPMKQPEEGFTREEIAVLTALRSEKTLHADMLLNRAGIGFSSFAYATLTLEMKGLIEQQPGRFFALGKGGFRV